MKKNLKKLFLITIFAASATTMCDAQIKTQLTPETTVLAFDLHGVLFKPNYGKIISILFKSGKTWTLLKNLFKPAFWCDIKALKKQHIISEQYIDELIKKYPKLLSLESTGIEIINAQDPIKSTITILKNLKTKGYKLYLISNIGPKSLKILKKRHNKIISLFDGFATPTKANGYLRKPNIQAFKSFIEQNKLQNKQIIFIDDKKKHLKPAQNAGIQHRILFKSASKLKKSLKMLGVTA